MDATIFLAKMWGPAILAVGLGIFISRDYYMRIYRDLEKDALAVLVFGMVAISAGVAQVSLHNVWGTFPEIVMSLLGWGLFLKGLAFTIFPKLISKTGYWEAKANLIPLTGVFTLILGAYLCWFAFLS